MPIEAEAGGIFKATLFNKDMHQQPAPEPAAWDNAATYKDAEVPALRIIASTRRPIRDRRTFGDLRSTQ